MSELHVPSWQFGPDDGIECVCDRDECLCGEEAEADDDARREEAEYERWEARQVDFVLAGVE